MSTANLPNEATRYVEFDDYVEFQLAKTRKSIRANDLMTAIAAVSALLLGGALLFVVLDHWVIPGGFSVAARWVWFTGLFGLIAGGVIWSIGIPALRRVNRLFAAKELEEADPALRSNLLNWVDLRDAGRIVNPGVMKTIEKQAATQLSKMDVGQAVDHHRLLQAAYALLAIVVLFCGYALFSPKKISTALWRMFPFTSAGAVTRTQILEVEPGDATLLVRGQLEVTATLSGELPETIQFLYSTADGRIKDEAVQLRPESEGLARYRGVFAGETGQGVLQDFTYYIAAGDAQSARYRVVVRQPPSATVQEVAYTFPEYMRLEETVSSGGHIDAWEGAVATISAVADKPCKSATLQFLSDPQSPPTGEELPVEVADGTNLRAVWTLGFRNDGTFPKHYRIQCRGEEGEVDPTPVVYNVNIKPDRPPEVVLLHPERDLTAPANGVIPLLVQASDPDFELGYINLHADQAGQSIHRQQLSEGRQQKVLLEHDFNLADLNLKPGDEFEFWVEAFDNRQPRRNRKNTPRIKVTIAEPATPEEAEQQLAEQKKERDERLEEANREQDGDTPDSEPMPQDGDGERGENDAEQNDRDPQEREPQPGEKGENDDRNAEANGTGESSDGKQPGDAQQKPGEGTESGKSPDKGGAQDSPLSPEGENDDEVLERLNELLNPKKDKDQPQDPSKSDRDTKSKDSGEKQPRDNDTSSQEDDGTSSDGDDGDDDSRKTAGEKSDRNESSKSRTPKSPKDQTSKDSDDSDSDPEPMPSEDTDPDGGSEAEPRSKPEGESNEKTRPSRGDKSPDSRTGDEPKPGDADSEKPEEKGEAGSDSDSENGNRKDQSKPTAKDDARGKPQPKPKTQPGDDGESKDSQEPSGDGDMPDEPGSDSEDKQSSQKSDDASQNQQKSKSGSKPKQKTGDKSSDQQSPEGDQEAGDEAGDETQGDDQAEPGDPKSGSKKSGSKSKSPSGKKPAGKNDPGSTSDPQDGDEPSDDMSDPGDEPTPSGDQDAETKSQEKSAKKSKGDKQSGEKSKSPPKDNDAEATQTKPGEEPSAEKSPPERNADPKGDAERKTQTRKPKEKPAEESEETGKGEEPSPDAEQNSEGDPDGADEELKGPGNPKGQKSDKPDGGEGGGSKQDKQGNPGGKTPGPGENADQPGNERVGKEGRGKPNPGDRRGEGSTKQESDKPGEGDGDGENGELSKKDGAESQQGGGKDSSGGGKSDQEGGDSGGAKSDGEDSGDGKSDKPSGKAGKGAKPGKGKPGASNASSNPTEGDAGANGFAGKGGDAEAVETDPEAANLDYNRRAAELVLQRLKDDLNNDNVDPKLLEELGWTPEQLQRFTDRLAKQLEKPADELSPLDEARRQQFEEMLKTLNLKSGGAQRTGDQAPQREIDQTGARRAPVPQDYKAAYEAFTKNLSKRKDAKPKAK